MNNNQKRTLSPASIVSMIGAMLFAIAAAVSIFLPVFSYDSKYNISTEDRNTMRISLLDEDTRKGFEQFDEEIDTLNERAEKASGTTKEKYEHSRNAVVAEKYLVIAATAAFGVMIAAALFVCLGKGLQFTGGGRALALVFSIIGVCAAGFYLAMMIWYTLELGKMADLYKTNNPIHIGAGPIVMAICSVGTLIFCCIGNGKGAYKYVGAPTNNNYNPNAPYNGYNDGFNANNFAQPPVQPQQPYNSYNPGGYAQPQNPYAPPVQPQNPFAAPAQQQNPYAAPAQPQNPFAPPIQPVRPQSSPVSGESTIPLNQINRGSGMSGEGTIPLSQVTKGSGMSGEGTIPLNQINKGSGMSGEGTIPLNQINKGTSGMSGEGTVPLNRVRSQSGEETVPLNRVRSQSGEGTIPLSMVGSVPKNAAVGTLKCMRGDFPSMSVDLKPDEKVIIGRDPATCSVIVGADRSDVSRTHCSIWYDPIKDSFKIKDTSSNGTFVNGQKLPKDQTVEIPDNSIISLGNGDNQFKVVKN